MQHRRILAAMWLGAMALGMTTGCEDPMSSMVKATMQAGVEHEKIEAEVDMKKLEMQLEREKLQSAERIARTQAQGQEQQWQREQMAARERERHDRLQRSVDKTKAGMKNKSSGKAESTKVDLSDGEA